MKLPEGLTKAIEQAQTLRVYFRDVKFELTGDPSFTAFYQLTPEEGGQLAQELSGGIYYNPQDLMLICDKNKQPRLVVVYGQKEMWKYGQLWDFGGRNLLYLGDKPYLHISAVSEDDNKIFIEDTRGIHLLKNQCGGGLNLESCLPCEQSKEGSVSIEQKNGVFVIKSEQAKASYTRLRLLRSRIYSHFKGEFM